MIVLEDINLRSVLIRINVKVLPRSLSVFPVYCQCHGVRNQKLSSLHSMQTCWVVNLKIEENQLVVLRCQ